MKKFNYLNKKTNEEIDISSILEEHFPEVKYGIKVYTPGILLMKFDLTKSHVIPIEKTMEEFFKSLKNVYNYVDKNWEYDINFFFNKNELNVNYDITFRGKDKIKNIILEELVNDDIINFVMENKELRNKPLIVIYDDAVDEFDLPYSSLKEFIVFLNIYGTYKYAKRNDLVSNFILIIENFLKDFLKDFKMLRILDIKYNVNIERKKALHGLINVKFHNPIEEYII